MPPPFDYAPSPGNHDVEVVRALRVHLERALYCLNTGDVAGARGAAALAAGPLPDPDLVIATDGRGYTVAGRAVSLRRRGALRRILLALAEHRLRAPGSALTRDQVLAAGWPGERMRADSGALRVYTAVRRLRQGGLGAALVTTDEGYLIDARVLVRLTAPERLPG